MKRFWLIALASVVIVTALVLAGYKEQVLWVLPYLLLGACPLMHMMHRRHKHGGKSQDKKTKP